MKALTLFPEWAAAIAHLGKRVENRDWFPPRVLIGQRFAIHSGKSIGGRPGNPSIVEACASLRRMRPEKLAIGFEERSPGCWDLCWANQPDGAFDDMEPA